jgi:hypothetical protein
LSNILHSYESLSPTIQIDVDPSPCKCMSNHWAQHKRHDIAFMKSWIQSQPIRCNRAYWRFQPMSPPSTISCLSLWAPTLPISYVFLLASLDSRRWKKPCIMFPTTYYLCKECYLLCSWTFNVSVMHNWFRIIYACFAYLLPSGYLKS